MTKVRGLRNWPRIAGILAASLAWSNGALGQSVTNAGAPHEAITLTVRGPQHDERTGPNPFSDVRLDWTVTSGQRSWKVPGYFAGCGKAADNGCTGGTIWRAHFVPPLAAQYTWRLHFRRGTDIALGATPGEPVPGDRATGSFTVRGTSEDPIRRRGLLRYTGDRYYRWSGDDSIFFKFGPDAPENTLAFAGFDATPDAKGLRKTWSAHVRDLKPGSERYRWRKGKGAGLLGAFDYLADSGANSVSMLLWNTGGDDRNVFPHLLATTPERYAAMEPGVQWERGVLQDRFDLSKLDQWQRALSYAEARGLHLHFKLQETENDRFMDGGALGRTRKLYLREMIARFGHFLAVSWNLGEENVQNAGDMRKMAAYLDALDAYDHPIVLHSYPHQKGRYWPMLGPDTALNGLSMQGRTDDFSDLRADVMNWTHAAERAGKPLVLAYDEPGSAEGGAGVDPDYPEDRLPSQRKNIAAHEAFLRDSLWNALTAGAIGVEAYYGYQTGCGDLDCQDHRSRAQLWREGRHALEFFDTHIGKHALAMRPHDELTVAQDDYVFADPGRRYVIVPGKGDIRLKMPGMQGRFDVSWFDRGNGGALRTGSIAQVPGGASIPQEQKPRPGGPTDVPLGTPPEGGSGRWVALVSRTATDSIMVQAENFVAQRLDSVRRWCRSTDCPPGWERPGAIGGHVALVPDKRVTHDDKLIRGENFSPEPGKMAILSYPVDFPTAGRWYLWVRAFSSGNEDNGVHAGIDGTWPESAARIQFCPGKGSWRWDSRQRTEENHCGVVGAVWLDVPTPGRHTVEFAMREDGFVMDAFYLTLDTGKPTELSPQSEHKR